jgi:hypothetical protein
MNNIYTASTLSSANAQSVSNAIPGIPGTITIKGNMCYACWHYIAVRVSDTDTKSFRLTASQVDDTSGSYKDTRVGQTREVYLAAGFTEKLKFILDNTHSFVLSGRLATGGITMYVGLDADNLGPNNFQWKSTSAGGLAYLAVRSTDVNFHHSAYFYVKLVASNSSDAWFTFTLQQPKSVKFIPNNQDYTFNINHPGLTAHQLYRKHQFQSESELIKFHVFKVPGAIKNGNTLTTRFYKAVVKVEALTANFYPLIFLKKVEL